MGRRRSTLAEAERYMYLTSRALGDVNAAKHRRLTKRVVQRRLHRRTLAWARRVTGGWW